MPTLSQLIEDFRDRFEQNEIAKRKYLYSISKEQLLKDLRNFGSVKINNKYRYSSHFKNNRWFNRNQVDRNGKITQLRDEFIIRMNLSELLTKPSKLRFDQLFDEVKKMYQEIKEKGVTGAGQMTLYDIACFIGGHLAIYPNQVYVHQGVIKGAKALGLIKKERNAIIEIDDVINHIPEFNVFKNDADLVESFLCIYKNELEQIQTL